MISCLFSFKLFQLTFILFSRTKNKHHSLPDVDTSIPSPSIESKPLPTKIPSPKHSASPNFNTQNDTTSDSSTHLSYLLYPSSLRESGRITFFGSSSNLNLLLEPNSSSNTFHFPLPELEGQSSSSRLNQMDQDEINVLKFRGAFLLPPRDLCDDIVDAYFEKVHPTIPLINRSSFMRKYNDSLSPPSLLLLQAVLLAGSRVCKNPALLDSSGSSQLATMTFYKRAKALYNSNYETDRIAIVQSLVLMSWLHEGPEDITENSFYWTRVSLTVAQGIGLHRSVDNSQMPDIDKRMWKRVWWSLFVRDRWAAVALGRPVLINLEDSDVPMITLDDFNEDEPGRPSPYPPNKLQSLYFIHAVMLSKIMGIVLNQHYSVDAEIMRRKNKIPSVSHCDMAMVSWMQALPSELIYKVADTTNHNFFTALLHAQYYTILCLVHRSALFHKRQTAEKYPSWGIAFQASHIIAKIMDNLVQFEEIQECPPFFIYTLLSAMLLLIFQTDSPIPTIVESAKKSFQMCRKALEGLSQTWMSAKILLQLFQQIDKNKKLNDQLDDTSQNKNPHSYSDVLVNSNSNSKERKQKGFDEHNGHNPLQSNKNNSQGPGSPHSNHDSLTVSQNTFQSSYPKISPPAEISPSEFPLVSSTFPHTTSRHKHFEPSQLFPEIYENPALSQDCFIIGLDTDDKKQIDAQDLTDLSTQIPPDPESEFSNLDNSNFHNKINHSKLSTADIILESFDKSCGLHQHQHQHLAHQSRQVGSSHRNGNEFDAHDPEIFSNLEVEEDYSMEFEPDSGYGMSETHSRRTSQGDSLYLAPGMMAMPSNALNLGDWYTYLTSTFPANENGRHTHDDSHVDVDVDGDGKVDTKNNVREYTQVLSEHSGETPDNINSPSLVAPLADTENKTTNSNSECP